jgi:GTP-binding protein HflX
MTYETEKPIEKAVLISVTESGEAEELLDELATLCDTAGVQVVGRLDQKRTSPHPQTYLGTGKIDELKAYANQMGANVIISDDELSPLQVRNLSDRLDMKVADRSTVILDIFAQHAHSSEGKLQVEMAQLAYLLPRLAGQGEGLSRIGSGAGLYTRGPGETKLETDRRHIRERMSELRRQVDELKGHRSLLREERRSRGYPLIALVGYTNVGKSTLLNALTEGGAYVKDELFATLDPTSREVELPDGRKAILTDTVGFIRKLPHTLVVAFRATLEEVSTADLLLQVYDISSATFEMERQTVESVLAEIGAGQIPAVKVYNKADRLDIKPKLDGVLVSAVTGFGLDELRATAARALPGAPTLVDLLVPYAQTDLQSWLHRVGKVREETYLDEGVRIVAEVDPADAERARKALGLVADPVEE